MYKLEISLKQNTPIIHFQWDQDGATLRASEVKPKLDKFIIEHILKEQNILFDYYEMIEGQKKFINAHEAFKRKAKNPDKDNEIQKNFKNWLVGNGKNEHVALNYKIKITTTNSYKYPIELKRIKNNVLQQDSIDSFPCYFGNIGKEEKPKYFVWTNEILTINFFILNNTLFDFLNSTDGKRIFRYFFNTRNFGTRQSKGFGSFSIVENNEIIFDYSDYYFDLELTEPIMEKLRNDHLLRFPNMPNFPDSELQSLYYWRQLFYDINLFHKVIKSGYNQNKGYVKSALFKYFKEIRNIQWDKKSIKQEYFEAELGNQEKNYKYDEVLSFDDSDDIDKEKSNNERLFLVRDLLGLASSSDWKGDLYSDAIITKSNNDIQRFKSPITYKPVLNSDKNGSFFNIFMCFDEIPEEFFNKTFSIKKNDTGDLELDTPTKEYFSLSDYFEYLVSDDFSINKLIKRKNHDTHRIELLFEMITQ